MCNRDKRHGTDRHKVREELGLWASVSSAVTRVNEPPQKVTMGTQEHDGDKAELAQGLAEAGW